MDSTTAPLRFGRFELQPASRRLLEDGTPVRLGGRAYDVLWALVQRRERPVPKQELMSLAWPNLVVEENNLQVQVVTLRKLLGPATIATIPGRGYQFTAPIEGVSLPAAASPAPAASEPGRASTNLPGVLPPLYGRDEDLDRVVESIQRHGLVTIVGPGGIGKTRLAEAAAHRLRSDFSDGAFVIELAPITDPALTASAVARALHLQLGAEAKAADLAATLAPRRLLLVLDNCEHLVDATAELAAALAREAPSVRILATSQEPLKLPDEQIYRLGTLELPDTRSAEAAREIGAVALFVARAQAAAPGFELTDANLPVVVDICRRLDGIALAIELAAARVPLLGVEGLRSRLDDRFRVLTAGARFAMRRHQTLRAALEWSHGLLTPDEQAVFRRLGVFAGTFGLDSAQRVAASDTLDDWSVLEILGALVDKSLVFVADGAEPRYRLLETGRAFALEQLAAAGETRQQLRQHSLAILALFERSRVEYWASTTNQRQARYSSELDNLRAALEWASSDDGDASIAVALAGASNWIWRDSGLHSEGLRRCEQALRRIGPDTPAAHEARLHLGYVEIGRNRSLPAAPARASAERAIALYRQLDDRQALYSALAEYARFSASAGDTAGAASTLAEVERLFDPSWPPALKHPLLTARSFVFNESHRVTEARKAWEERLALERLIGDTQFATTSLTNLADALFAEGHPEEAIARGRELVALIRREGFANWESFALGNLSAALTAIDQLDEALKFAQESMPLLKRQGSIWSFLDHFGLLAFKRGHHEAAARALGCAEALNRSSGYVRQFNEFRARNQLLELLTRHFDASQLQRLMDEGGQLSADEAARTALAG